MTLLFAVLVELVGRVLEWLFEYWLVWFSVSLRACSFVCLFHRTRATCASMASHVVNAKLGLRNALSHKPSSCKQAPSRLYERRVHDASDHAPCASMASRLVHAGRGETKEALHGFVNGLSRVHNMT